MERLMPDQLQNLSQQYGHLPAEYLEWLKVHGWGETPKGFMVYSAPVGPEDVFEEENAARFSGILIVADDMAGYSVGFRRLDSGWELVGIDSALMEVESLATPFSERVGSKS